MPDLWIQLENKKWDMMPRNTDRMTGRNGSISPTPAPTAADLAKTVTRQTYETVTITSPDAAGTGIRVSHSRRMYAPLRDVAGQITDALIYRRYKAPDPAKGIGEWQVPDDRKINPWDMNESDPTDAGTMGTIPGPVIECNVGEAVTIHFRNLDFRDDPAAPGTKLPAKKRSHSMHVHGFVFEATSDGAYPLSPESAQAMGAEAPFWHAIGEDGANKKGDRVPPMGTYIYEWKTFGWPSTAGVWLYHDHSFCDMDNIGLGAIGMVVIHNTADSDNEVINQDLPDGNVNGSPVKWVLEPFFAAIDLLQLQERRFIPVREHPIGQSFMPVHTKDMPMKPAKKGAKPVAVDLEISILKKMEITHIVDHGDLSFGVAIRPGLDILIRGLFTPKFKQPPLSAQYLFLFHELSGQPGMCINGRTYLGNTPSVLAGTETKMRFGVVGMGNAFHTFHIHGHRWILPGPSGTTPGGIQSSPQNHPVSQFEDTRTFGPANSFVFSINGKSGSFMRAGGPSADLSKGEWHLHCHVLQHMMDGMMGSLLIKAENDPASLPSGTPCDAPDAAPLPTQHVVTINNSAFSAASLPPVKMGETVRFNNIDAGAPEGHSIFWDTAGSPANSSTFFNGQHRDVTMTTVGTFNYHCGVHGPSMHGTINVTM